MIKHTCRRNLLLHGLYVLCIIVDRTYIHMSASMHYICQTLTMTLMEKASVCNYYRMFGLAKKARTFCCLGRIPYKWISYEQKKGKWSNKKSVNTACWRWADPPSTGLSYIRHRVLSFLVRRETLRRTAGGNRLLAYLLGSVHFFLATVLQNLVPKETYLRARSNVRQ